MSTRSSRRRRALPKSQSSVRLPRLPHIPSILPFHVSRRRILAHKIPTKSRIAASPTTAIHSSIVCRVLPDQLGEVASGLGEATIWVLIVLFFRSPSVHGQCWSREALRQVLTVWTALLILLATSTHNEASGRPKDTYRMLPEATLSVLVCELRKSRIPLHWTREKAGAEEVRAVQHCGREVGAGIDPVRHGGCAWLCRTLVGGHAGGDAR